MQTITVDILDAKAIKLLQNLELLNLIRMRNADAEPGGSINWAKKYKGKMTRQSVSDIDRQLDELRSEWE